MTQHLTPVAVHELAAISEQAVAGVVECELCECGCVRGALEPETPVFLHYHLARGCCAPPHDGDGGEGVRLGRSVRMCVRRGGERCAAVEDLNFQPGHPPLLPPTAVTGAVNILLLP